MDLYDVRITDRALSQLEQYIEYIRYELGNPTAAENLWRDAVSTADELSRTAGNLAFCYHPKLRKHGYRVVSFRSHRYVMIYHIEDRVAYVDAVYHQLQDYQNLFKPKQE